MAHIAESLHWYDRKGQPRYTIVGSNGKERPTTLRDARKHGFVPSVTEIIKCSNKPGLNRWMLDQMLHAALTLPRKDGETEAQYISRIWQDSQETARKAAERGTKIHAAIQGFFQHEPAGEFMPHVQGACDAVRDWCGEEFDHEACLVEKAFSHPLGFGGKVDLLGFSPLFVVDFKTKEFGEDADLKTWDEHAMQLAAYRHGLEMPDAKCAIVYVSSTVPGLCRLIEIEEEKLKAGWKMFYSLLHYWQAKNKYASAFSPEALAA